jgi:hypothetical protein
VRDLTYLRADMEFLYDNGVPAGAVDELDALFAREELIIEKRTKHKSLAEINIAPLIKSVSFAEGENVVTAEVVVAAQNPGLNPAFLAQAVERQLPALAPDFVRVRRKELFDAQMEIFR